jgi:hypothetical protein
MFFNKDMQINIARNQSGSKREIFLHRATATTPLASSNIKQGADEQRHRASAASDSRNDAHGFARGHQSLKTLQVTHIVVGNKQVHESTQATIVIKQTIFESGVSSLKIGQYFAKRCALN